MVWISSFRSPRSPRSRAFTLFLIASLSQHQGPHPVRNHSPPLHTCGRDESPSRPHSHANYALQRTPPLSTFHTAVQDTIDHIKLATKQLRRLCLILRRLEQANRPGFKGLRIALRSTRPRNLDRVYPCRRLDPRYPAVDKTPMV